MDKKNKKLQVEVNSTIPMELPMREPRSDNKIAQVVVNEITPPLEIKKQIENSIIE